MRFRLIPCEQRTPEWVAARLGRLTSTRANDMLATRKDGKEAAGRKNLLVALALERLTGRSQDRAFQSPAMLHGSEQEDAARAAYRALTGEWLETTGFVAHADLMAGCSLDGHVGDIERGVVERIVEIKAPLPATHLEYIETGRVPLDYQRQIDHALWITGAAFCDFFSYCPEFEPVGLDKKLVRIERDEARIAEHEKKAIAFLAEVEAKVNAIKTLGNLRVQLEASLA